MSNRKRIRWGSKLTKEQRQAQHEAKIRERGERQAMKDARRYAGLSRKKAEKRDQRILDYLNEQWDHIPTHQSQVDNEPLTVAQAQLLV